MQTKHEAVTDVDKSMKAKEKKMQMDCNSKSVRREMACCAALDRLE